MARKLLTQLSYRRGAPYVEAVVGLEAIEKFEEFAPHLVLPDICMPVNTYFYVPCFVKLTFQCTEYGWTYRPKENEGN